MKKNLGPYDRTFRLAGGLLLSSMAYWGPKQKWLLSFLVPAFTGLVGKCPFYSALDLKPPTKEPAKTKEVESQANEYFPVQSDSEIAAGHPIVGSA